MKYRLYLTIWFLLAFAPASLAQQPPLSPDERRQILRALIDRDEAQGKVRELMGQLQLVDDQTRLLNERIQLERDQRLAEKKLHLGALIALREYRTTRRPLILKVVTFGIVRDKKDVQLEQTIASLESEIRDWH